MGDVRHRTLTVLLAAAALLSACGLGGPRTFEGRIGALDVTVIDGTGHVEAIWFGVNSELADPFVSAVNPPGRPDVVIVGWFTRECGHSTLTLEFAGGRLSVRVRTPVGDCTNDVAVPRTVRITFDRHVDAATVDVEDARDT